MVRKVRRVGAPADGLAIRVNMYFIWQCAVSRPQSHHTCRETHRALQPRQPRFAQPHSTLRPTFSAAYRLPAGTHDAAQPTRHQQPHLARAPAGHRSPNRSRCRRTPATPRITPPRSSKPSHSCSRLPRPSVQRQHVCNRDSSSVSTQIGSEIASQQGLAEHIVRTMPTGHEPVSSNKARRLTPTGAT